MFIRLLYQLLISCLLLSAFGRFTNQLNIVECICLGAITMMFVQIWFNAIPNYNHK